MNRTLCLIFAFIFVIMVIPVFYICFALSAEMDSLIVAVVPPALCFFIACLFMYRAECLMIQSGALRA